MSEAEAKEKKEAIDVLRNLPLENEEIEPDTLWLDALQLIVPLLFLICALSVMYYRGILELSKPSPGGKASPAREVEEGETSFLIDGSDQAKWQRLVG